MTVSTLEHFISVTTAPGTWSKQSDVDGRRVEEDDVGFLARNE
jgi:hypothetical protein